jgi:hypothetical protein
MKGRLTLFVLSLLLTLPGCETLPTATISSEHRVHHVVLCWLKEPGNSAQRKQLIKQTRLLRRIPGVRELRVGESIASDRAIVDDSFDIGIVMTFDNEADMNWYLQHPQHRWAVKEHILPLTRKILVYDFKGR